MISKEEKCKTSFDLHRNQEFLYTRGGSNFTSGSKAGQMVLAYSKMAPPLEPKPVPNYMLAIHKRFKSPDLAARANTQIQDFSNRQERALIREPHLSSNESGTVKLAKQFHLTSYSNHTLQGSKSKTSTLSPQESYYNWTRAPNFPPRAGSLLKTRLEKHYSQTDVRFEIIIFIDLKEADKAHGWKVGASTHEKRCSQMEEFNLANANTF